MRRRWAGPIPLLALSGLLLACFGRLALHPGDLIVDGERPSVDEFQKIEPRRVGNDLTELFLPRQLRISSRVAAGRWPSSWDPDGFCGRPRVGNPQAGLFYPPAWPAWWSGSPSALGWLTVGHLLWGGLGVYTLCRRFGCGAFAATIASGVFATSPYVLAQVFEGHYPHVWGAYWGPWALLAADCMRKGDLRGGLALPPILAMAGLTGHAQEAYYVAIGIGAWLTIDAARRFRKGERGRPIASILMLGAAFALSAGLVAVELIPDAAAAAWGRKADRLGLVEASKYHVDLLNLAQILDPRALGGPGDFLGHENYWETILSIGWVPFVLACIGLARFPDRSAARGWGALAILSVGFAAGWKLGLFAILYEAVPGMDRFRVPARSLFLASLAGSVLSGFGVEALRSGAIGMSGLDWPRQRRRLAILLLLIGSGHAFTLIRGPGSPDRIDPTGEWSDPDRRPRSGRGREASRWALAASRIATDPVFWASFGGVASAMAWLHRRPWDGRRVAVGLGALAWLEMAGNGLSLLKTAPPGRFLGPDPVAGAIAEQGDAGPIRIRARDGFYTDLRAGASGLEKTNLNDAFQVGRSADLYEALYPIFGPFRSVEDSGAMAGEVREYRKAVRQAVLDRLGVAFLVTDRVPPGARWPVVEVGDWGDDRFTVYRNPTALPRAYVVPRAEPIDDDRSILSAFLQVSASEAVLMASDPLGPGGDWQSFKPASYRSDDPDRVEVSVETNAPGLLVVADAWMPGWSGSLDGRPAPIFRGNHAQRVIALPTAGAHRIVMRYRAPGLSTGIAVTATSAAIWLVGVAWMVARRGRGPLRVRPMRGRAPGRDRRVCWRSPAKARSQSPDGADSQSLVIFPDSISSTQRM